MDFQPSFFTPLLQFSTHFCAVSQIILKRLAGEMPSNFLKFISHSGLILNLKERGAGRG